MNKKLLCVILLILSFCFTTQTTLAHSGRTDSDGGHRDGSTGEYHYHHGYPAHQHTNGVCPYDYDDKTGSSSGASTVYNYKSQYDDYVDTTAKTKRISDLEQELEKANNEIGQQAETIEQQKTTINQYSEYISNLWLFLIASLVALLCFILAYIRTRQKVKLTAELLRLKKAIQISDAIKNAQEEVEQIKKTLIPDGIELTGDGLPKQQGALEYWGDEFTVYTNYGSNIYHSSDCRYAKSASPKNVALLQSFYTPCKLCHPSIPDLTWYKQYQKAVKKIDDEKWN